MKSDFDSDLREFDRESVLVILSVNEELSDPREMFIEAVAFDTDNDGELVPRVELSEVVALAVQELKSVVESLTERVTVRDEDKDADAVELATTDKMELLVELVLDADTSFEASALRVAVEVRGRWQIHPVKAGNPLGISFHISSALVNSSCASGPSGWVGSALGSPDEKWQYVPDTQ